MQTRKDELRSVSSSLHPMGRYHPYGEGGPRVPVRTTPVRCIKPLTPRAPLRARARASSRSNPGRRVNFAGAGETILRKLHTNVCQYAGCTTTVGAWHPCGPRRPLRLPRPQQTMPIAAAVAVVSAEAADGRRPPPTASGTRKKQLFHLVAVAIAHQWTDMNRGKRPPHIKGGQKNLPGTIDGLWL